MGKLFVFVACLAAVSAVMALPVLAQAGAPPSAGSKTVQVDAEETGGLGGVTVKNTGTKKEKSPYVKLSASLASKDGDGVRKGDVTSGLIELGGKYAAAEISGLSKEWTVAIDKNQAGVDKNNPKLAKLKISGDGGTIKLESNSYMIEVTAVGGSITVQYPGGQTVVPNGTTLPFQAPIPTN